MFGGRFSRVTSYADTRQAMMEVFMERPKKFTITENRVEQWETEYGVKELGIYGSEQSGLIQALAEEVWKLRTIIASNNVINPTTK
jgi:hypothetical protein